MTASDTWKTDKAEQGWAWNIEAGGKNSEIQ